MDRIDLIAFVGLRTRRSFPGVGIKAAATGSRRWGCGGRIKLMSMMMIRWTKESFDRRFVIHMKLLDKWQRKDGNDYWCWYFRLDYKSKKKSRARPVLLTTSQKRPLDESIENSFPKLHWFLKAMLHCQSANDFIIRKWLLYYHTKFAVFVGCCTILLWKIRNITDFKLLFSTVCIRTQQFSSTK